uniref:Secreted protein n=1 Tax=Sinocyclocheilus anshuiensis TaxID=1608454 RepID=A0A671PCN3_9TELE
MTAGWPPHLRLIITLLYSHSSSSSFHCSVFTRSLFPPVWPYPHSVSWDRKNNPEPWNNLGPTYQNKVNIPATAL